MKTPLYSGIITNYHCPAACRHCMFASAPSCAKAYMTEESAEKLASLLREAGTSSVHIGGGEPFMDFNGLCQVVKILHRYDIDIDYIETNAFWCKDVLLVENRLRQLMDLGVSTIMASVDPYHIEYVPLERPLMLCKAAEKCGMEYFIWQQRYLQRLSRLDPTVTHTKSEIAAVLGEDYISQTAAEYGLGINGRALSIADSLYMARKVVSFLDGENCRKMLQPHHCHFDLYGNAIPSGCTGLAVPAETYLRGEIDAQKYPVFYRLIHGGVTALYAYGTEKGFVPAERGYPTKCALCYAIRSWLMRNSPSADLGPADFYLQVDSALSGPEA